MTRSRRAKWAALVSVAAIAAASATIGVTQGAFAGQTSNGANIITAAPDFRGPTVTPLAIGKNSAARRHRLHPDGRHLPRVRERDRRGHASERNRRP